MQKGIRRGPDWLMRASRSERRTGYWIGLICWICWLTVTAAAVPATAARSGPAAAGPLETLITLLLDDDFEAQRPFIETELAKLSDPCGTLGRLATYSSDRVRENAVRALDAGGCADFTSYRPFLGDRSPWVVEALIHAARRQRLREAVPYLIERLGDRRRIIRDDRTTTIGRLAHDALVGLTCHSFHDGPLASSAARPVAVADWKGWYDLHRDDPGDEWTQSGIALARAALARDDGAARTEAFRTLALCGALAATTLRGAFDRGPADLQAKVSCNPEEPPRVGDQISCVLEVQNVSRRRLAIAPDPGGPGVRLIRIVPAPTPSPPGSRPAGKQTSSRPGTTSGESASSGPAARRDDPSIARSEAHSPGATAVDIVAVLVDLGPGEMLRREFVAGPVLAAGRYEVHAVLRDLASDLVALPEISAATALRFEQ